MYLENGKIRIRNASPDDAPILVSWWNDGSIMAHAGFPNGLGTDEDTVRSQILDESDDTIRRHVIEYDGVPIGEMNYRNKGSGRCEIGIKITVPSMQNRGLGKKILSLFITGLFECLDYSLICLDTNLNNLRAQHVYEQLGFRKIRVNIDSWTDQLGRAQSSVDYELTREGFHPYR